MDFENGELKVDKRTMARYIDHTLLKPDAAAGAVLKLCEEAAQWRFASVCINPVFVPLATERLKNTGVRVCTVTGFPLGASAPETKIHEARLAVLQGAGEIDMVIRIGAIKEGRYDLVGDDIAGVVKGVREINEGVIVKVIIEACLLTDDEKVQACRTVKAAGAHFVKTSTGFSSGGATLRDIVLMRQAVGPDIGVKAAGGIRTTAQAIEFIKAGAARIGTSSGVAILQELP
ncbi:MAG: deoxyribose-phosphate aldolase [Eubacteriales bacterium]